MTKTARKEQKRKPLARPAPASTVWKNRIVGYGEEPPDKLLANEKNWRMHPKSQQDALKGALSKVGIVQNVIVNRRSGKMIDGHLRAQMAISENQPTVPITYVDLSDDEEALILATIDPVTGLAGTDQELLDSLTTDIRLSDLGMDLGTGLNDLLNSLSPDLLPFRLGHLVLFAALLTDRPAGCRVGPVILDQSKLGQRHLSYETAGLPPDGPTSWPCCPMDGNRAVAESHFDIFQIKSSRGCRVPEHSCNTRTAMGDYQ